MANKIYGVVGGGIAGLSCVLAFIRKGERVHLFESNSAAYEASIRNFGLIWPSGQPFGPWRDIAFHSRSLWREASEICDFQFNMNGSLYLAKSDIEENVMQWYVTESEETPYPARWLERSELSAMSEALTDMELKGGLFCPFDATVLPLEALRRIENYISQHPLVTVHYMEKVLILEDNRIVTSKDVYEVDHVYVASGNHFRDWYPDLYHRTRTQKCKLYMYRTEPMPEGWNLGPTLCGGLTLLHYDAFKKAPEWTTLNDLLSKEWAEQRNRGIHVLVAQHLDRRLTIGDSHYYGDDLLPFNDERDYVFIEEYLKTFASLPPEPISQRWEGIYSRSGDGLPLVEPISQSTTFIGAFGGAGMTLAMGLCDLVVKNELPVDSEFSSARFS